MNIKSYGTERCAKCSKDITDKAKYYDKQADGRYGKPYCEECNRKIKNSNYE